MGPNEKCPIHGNIHPYFLCPDRKKYSVCCDAEAVVNGIPDFPGDKKLITLNHTCKKCHKPCDIKNTAQQLRITRVSSEEIARYIKEIEEAALMPQIFSYSPKEAEKIRLWLEDHDGTCPYAKRNAQGAAGGRLTFAFTPTGIGTAIEVICACGAKENITDYDSW